MSELRTLMIRRIRQEIGDPNGNYRYGSSFYTPKEPITRRERKFNERALENKKINLNILETMEDDELLQAYDRFSRRFNVQM